MTMMNESHVRTEPVLFRRELGDVLRDYRQRQGRTLREVSSDARVSLGYLSEVERGQKEASSELLQSICRALNVSISHVLRVVADRIDLAEGRTPPMVRKAQAARAAGIRIPDTAEALLNGELSSTGV